MGVEVEEVGVNGGGGGDRGRRAGGPGGATGESEGAALRHKHARSPCVPCSPMLNQPKRHHLRRIRDLHSACQTCTVGVVVTVSDWMMSREGWEGRG